MKLIRSNITPILKLAFGSVLFSWVLTGLVIPLQVAALGKSHQVFSVYNAEEGCFELIIDHHKDIDPEHLAADEEHEYYSIHNSCCYDDFLVKTRKDVDHQTEYSAVPKLLYATSSHSENHSFTLLENNLPPPRVSLDVLRVTRLLI